MVWLFWKEECDFTWSMRSYARSVERFVERSIGGEAQRCSVTEWTSLSTPHGGLKPLEFAHYKSSNTFISRPEGKTASWILLCVTPVEIWSKAVEKYAVCNLLRNLLWYHRTALATTSESENLTRNFHHIVDYRLLRELDDRKVFDEYPAFECVMHVAHLYENTF